MGYAAGAVPPCRTSFSDFLKAAHTLALAQGESHRAVKATSPKATVGSAYEMAPAYPKTDSYNDRAAAVRYHAMNNVFFLEAAMKGNYPKTFVGEPPYEQMFRSSLQHQIENPPMQPPLTTGASPRTAPSFCVIDRQPLRPAAILLAFVIAASALAVFSIGLSRSRTRHFADAGSNAERSASTTRGGVPAADERESDDPSQIDTIVLGDAADAPVPGRRGDHVSAVHATIIVRLPRFGSQVGLIPDTSAGRLLFGWLAAFNQASYPALEKALPNEVATFTAAAQMELRRQSEGFNLLSAKEVQPGVLVFRLRDQTPSASEVLGTLQVRPDSSPATIASFSLRAVLPKGESETKGAMPVSLSSTR